jgi:hypothetical protein
LDPNLSGRWAFATLVPGRLYRGGGHHHRTDREELAQRLPAGHVIDIEGGHCLHRDAPADWLIAVDSIID